MTKKTNPKRVAQLSHKLVVLCDLLLDTVEELGAEESLHEDLSKASLQLKEFCERVVEDGFTSEVVASTTYIQDLASKVDTLIRKNYKLIPSVT